MRVLVYTKLTPMGFYRLIWPAMALQRQGYDVDIANSDDPRSPIRWVEEEGQASVSVPDYDVVVVQRITERRIVDAINTWQKNGVRVVIDMDDNLKDITPGQNVGAFKLLNQSGPDLSWRWSEIACDMADAVTVSTSALAEMYGSGRATILRNCIPQAYLSIPRWQGEGLIGWTGSLKFRQDDPSVLGGTIPRLQAQGFEFGTVGLPTGIMEAFKTSQLRRTGAVNFSDYPQAMSMFTVGITPLKRNKFNLSKSWLKPLEFMALGVPVVMSDMPEYRRLGMAWNVMVEEPLFYASKVGHWYSHLTTLLRDRELREEYSRMGRELAGRFTYERLAHHWWEAWTGKPA